MIHKTSSHRSTLWLALAACVALAGCSAAEAGPTPNAAASPGPAAGVATGVVRIEVEGVRNGNGQLLGLLFDRERGFPTKPNKAVKQTIVPSAKGVVTVTFDDVAAGTYAASVVHDENGNGKLDANVIGIPKEGVGASNRAKGRFGPPKWKDAKFTVDGDTKIPADLWYP